jgi:hypothetical protein
LLSKIKTEMTKSWNWSEYLRSGLPFIAILPRLPRMGLQFHGKLEVGGLLSKRNGPRHLDIASKQRFSNRIFFAPNFYEFLTPGVETQQDYEGGVGHVSNFNLNAYIYNIYCMILYVCFRSSLLCRLSLLKNWPIDGCSPSFF